MYIGLLYSTCCRCLIPGKHSEMDYAVAFYVSHAVIFLMFFRQIMMMVMMMMMMMMMMYRNIVFRMLLSKLTATA